MVDFPEGYGFAPTHAARVMQRSFLVDIGTFTSRSDRWMPSNRRRSPFVFDPIGFIRKMDDQHPIRGILFTVQDTPIEGTLQEVVTAMCTIHRMGAGRRRSHLSWLSRGQH